MRRAVGAKVHPGGCATSGLGESRSPSKRCGTVVDGDLAGRRGHTESHVRIERESLDGLAWIDRAVLIRGARTAVVQYQDGHEIAVLIDEVRARNVGEEEEEVDIARSNRLTASKREGALDATCRGFHRFGPAPSPDLRGRKRNYDSHDG
jgi:hypothetical protein